MYSKPKDIEDSPKFKKFCRDKGIAKTTQKKYKYSLYRYAKFHNKLLEDLIEEADIEEDEGVRLNKRKLRDQIIDFRSYLIHDTDYEFETIDTSIICVKSFYRFYAITIPDIPPYPHKNSDNKNIGFDELPNMNAVRTVIEGARKPKHKALYLFAACTGTARRELANFTYGQFLEGVLEYCPMAKTPQDIINALDGKCEELMVIPVFKMYREKTDYIYYTPITPECTQFMINYLKAEGLHLKPEDKFFQLTSSTISSTFENANNKYNWGKIGSYGYFSCHRLRKFNASMIEDQEFGNYIQGRKPSKIKETYFKKDKKRIREKYKEHMYKFTIYAHYDILVNSEEFNKLQKENNQLREALKKEKKEHEEAIAKLKESNNVMSSRLDSLQGQMDNLASVRNRSNIEKTIYDYFNANFKEDILEQEEDVSIGRKKCNILSRLAYGIAMEEESNFRDDDDYLNSLIQRAIVKYTLDPSISERYKLTSDEVKFVAKYTPLTMEIVELIKSNNVLWDMVKDDLIKLNNLIVYVLKNNVDNIDNLTDEDKDDIVQEVLMEYLTVD